MKTKIGDVVRLQDEPRKNKYRVTEIRGTTVIMVGIAGEYHGRFRTPNESKIVEVGA